MLVTEGSLWQVHIVANVIDWTHIVIEWRSSDFIVGMTVGYRIWDMNVDVSRGRRKIEKMPFQEKAAHRF